MRSGSEVPIPPIPQPRVTIPVALLSPNFLARRVSAIAFCITTSSSHILSHAHGIQCLTSLTATFLTSPTARCSQHIPRKMAGPSTNTTQRLLRELKDYAKSPNEALLHLGPVDDEDLLRWEAVLKGVNGTPYEGMRRGPTHTGHVPN